MTLLILCAIGLISAASIYNIYAVRKLRVAIKALHDEVIETQCDILMQLNHAVDELLPQLAYERNRNQYVPPSTETN